jgi:hypothetical protein
MSESFDNNNRGGRASPFPEPAPIARAVQGAFKPLLLLHLPTFRMGRVLLGKDLPSPELSQISAYGVHSKDAPP